jgi:hypothetical protein
MLMVVWEWLRGYHKWTQTEARIEFEKQEHTYHDKDGKDLHYSSVTARCLVWTDAAGQKHSASLKQLDDKPPYRLVDGESETIRYNPANPDQFYCGKLSGIKVRYYVTMTFTIIGIAIFCIGSEWIRSAIGCSR